MHVSNAIDNFIESTLDKSGNKPLADQREHKGEGAPPSNTAPTKYKFRQYLHGVDSLYLSFYGKLKPEMAFKLEELKRQAQSFDALERSQAYLVIGDDRFIVHPKGKGQFFFVLENSEFHIQLSSDRAVKKQMAYVQVRSELLHRIGPVEAVEKLKTILQTLGDLSGEVKVSRVDLHVDFSTKLNFEQLTPYNFYGYAQDRFTKHYQAGELTGFQLGNTDLALNIYDKTHEIQISHKEWFRELWKESGWNGLDTVWRIEYQIYRDRLRDYQLSSFDQLIPNIQSLWENLTSRCVRMLDPVDEDANQSRWPTHAFWMHIQNAFNGGTPSPSLAKRPDSANFASDEHLSRMFLSVTTTYMAREGIAHPQDAILDLIRISSQRSPLPLPQYCLGKAAEKAHQKNVTFPFGKDDYEHVPFTADSEGSGNQSEGVTPHSL